MTDVFNVLRAMVADGTKVTILKAGHGLEIAAVKTTADVSPISAVRLLSLSDDNDALCQALVEMYLQLRAPCADKPETIPLPA